MPSTYSNLVPVRRIAVGDCSGPMGSAFGALARSAHAALLRADWQESDEPPFLPVHDNGQTANKTIPRGDVWKCSYGYDAAARTERSACGAVCYSFALPADATAGTPAGIASVSLSLTGDRYLDAGVDLYIVPSASATPPSVADLAALTPAGTYCATSGQSPTPPNERNGVTAAVDAALGVAAQPYLHVALLLHDYDGNRGAWIEGGAMLDGGAATIEFSRSVAPDPAPAQPGIALYAVTGTTGDGSISGTSRLMWYATGLYRFWDMADGESHYATDDAPLILRLFATAEAPDTNGIIAFKAEVADFVPRGMLAFSNNTLVMDIVAYAYHAPAASIAGRTVNVKDVRAEPGKAGRVRVGLVQSSAAVEDGGRTNGHDLFRAVAWPQLLDGAGDDLIGWADVDASATEADVDLLVERDPTLPFLYLVVLPLASGVSAYVSPYAATQSGLGVAPWKIDIA